MTRRRTTFTVLGILAALAVSFFIFQPSAKPDEPLPAATAGAQSTAAAVNAFALDLFAKLRTTPGNRCFSPYSIHSALSMTHAGAAGKTAEQLAAALHLTPAARAGQNDLHHRLQAPGNHGFQLDVANRLWLDRTATVLPAFTATLTQDFLADSQSVNFANASAAADAINTWTNKQTHGRIPAALTPSDIAPLTTFVLTNTLYFSGKWDKPFKKSATAEGDFFPAPGQKTRTMLMSQDEKHAFAQFDADGATPAFRVLSLNYTCGDLAMLLLLPDLGRLDALEAALNEKLLNSVVEDLAETKLPVVLPRFTITDSYSLQKLLEEMGVTDAFNAKAADFSGMCPQPLFLTAVIHKTFLEVTEQGTEAAAVTHAGMGGGGMGELMRSPPEFIANHPFLFLIRDKYTGSILFLGRFAKP